MRRILRLTAIGCGGLIGLFLFLGVVGAVLGGGGGTDSPPERAERREGFEQANRDKPKSDEEKIERKEEQAGVEASPSDPPRTQTAPSPTVTVTRAVDGDTIEIRPAVDGKDTVRLIGIDAPEEASSDCRAQPLASDATLEASLWENLEVRLEFDEERTDRYGRLLAYVNDPMLDQMMNVEMLRSGYAQAYTVPPNTKHEDELRAAQQEAKDLSIGGGFDVWSLSPGKDSQLADHGNGIGEGDGACPSKQQPEPSTITSASASASASASPDASPNPNSNPNRNAPRPNAPDPSAPSSVPSGASPAGGGADCEPPAYPVPEGDERDGDNDGCAGEE